MPLVDATRTAPPRVHPIARARLAARPLRMRREWLGERRRLPVGRTSGVVELSLQSRFRGATDRARARPARVHAGAARARFPRAQHARATPARPGPDRRCAAAARDIYGRLAQKVQVRKVGFSAPGPHASQNPLIRYNVSRSPSAKQSYRRASCRLKSLAACEE